MTGKGMTLIELMLAMLISMLLIGGAIQLFIGSKQTYQLSQTIGNLQESARFAAFLLQQDIRMAGYLGCNSRSAKAFNPSGATAAAELRVNTAYDPTSDTMNSLYVLDGGLQGWEAENTADGEYAAINHQATRDIASTHHWSTSAVGNDAAGAANMAANTHSLPHSDAIRLWRVQGEPATVNAVNSASISLSSNPGIDAGDMLLLTDCANVDVVRACNVSGGSGTITVATNGCVGVNNARPLITRAGALAFALVGKSYFVGRRIDNAAHSTATLYQREWRDPSGATTQPVLENIESLQFLYGEDTDTQNPDGIANRYVTADRVGDWRQIVSVRVEILVQSERADLLPKPQIFTFNGQSDVVGADGRLRYAFISTIALRNRAP